jgi:hypothetical protein
VGTRKVSAAKAGSPEVVRVLTVAGKESVKVDLDIVLPIFASANPTPSAVSTSAPSPVSLAAKKHEQSAPSRAGLMISLSTTAALAVETGVFGYLALGAQKDLNDQVAIYPNTRDNIENARSKSKNYGYITDAIGAATLVSGGVALYFALTHGGDPQKPESGKTDTSIVMAPTLGGMVVEGTF